MNIKTELKKNMKANSGYLVASNPRLFQECILKMISPFEKVKVDKIVSPEAKGFIYGPVIAYKINKPFVPVFKSGRVPKRFVISQEYIDYSKKTKSIDLGKITIKKDDRVLIVDDTFETGESGKAAISLINKLGGKVVGVSIVYNKLKKSDKKFFKKYNLKYLVKM